MEGEGDSSINLAEAGAHVLLEALHVHCQQGGAPAHHNGFVSITTYFQIESHSALAGQVACMTAMNGSS